MKFERALMWHAKEVGGRGWHAFVTALQGASERVTKAIKEVLNHTADYDLEERISTRGKMLMSQLKPS